MGYIYDRFGRLRNTEDIAAVTRLFSLKEKHGSDPWPVIEECFKVWNAKRPTHWKSHLINVENIRQTRKDRKFASSTDKKTGGIHRYIIDIPQDILFMIRLLYTPEELPMNRDFNRTFARKYPQLVIPEKI